ncbi:MAG: pyrroline-5-carboxylate reductase [Thermodesulfovibrionales bacterium]|nr:pyrroline-5-carboxylate reductase [Thermodesulfovibrionales bacterium]
MIGFIGGGNMAEAIVKGMLQSSRYKKEDIVVSEPRDERRKYLKETFQIKTTSDNRQVVKEAPIIVLAVKPQNMDEVLREISVEIDDTKTIVSIAAGISLSYLKEKLKTSKLIRVMPNTPALVQEGMSVISLYSCLPMELVAPVRDIFMSIGKVIHLPEEKMDAVTALSGSGPAFIAYFLECLINAGEKLGLTYENSSELTIQTLIGTSRLLEEGISLQKIREMVTSPGGTTAAGLLTFQKMNFQNIITEALQSAFNRSKELGRR